MEKINIAELLKDCPKGMELDCILFKDTPVHFYNVTTDTNYPIEIKVEYPSKELETFFLNKYGAIYDRPTANCIIFPKGKTTWEGFVPPYKFSDGDIVATKNGNFIGIVEVKNNKQVGAYCSIDYANDFGINVYYVFDRLATTWEKAKLFQAIKDNGYKWNAETKILEKLVKPNFKVGDRVKHKISKNRFVITEITESYYVCDYLDNKCDMCYSFYINSQDEYELTPNKFDVINFEPFMKVLVRTDNSDIWECDFFSSYNPKCSNKFHCIGTWYSKCIPYIGNEHLLNTTNDCDDFYKTWEE